MTLSREGRIHKDTLEIVMEAGFSGGGRRSADFSPLGFAKTGCSGAE
jgi:hypothetical protein